MTDFDAFNSVNRHISASLSLTLLDGTPLEITSNDYLIDFKLDERIWDASSDLFGAPVANAIDITLANPGRLFSINNTEGPYFDKIGANVKIVCKLHLHTPKEVTVTLGTFTVVTWQATIDGRTVAIYAASRLDAILNKIPTGIHVKDNTTVNAFISYYLQQQGVPANKIKFDDVDKPLQFGWSTGMSDSDLQQLSIAIASACYTDRQDNICFKALQNMNALAGTFTDNDQLIEVTQKQTLLNTFDCLRVSYNQPTKENNSVLLSVTEMPLSAGSIAMDKIAFQAAPVAGVDSIKLTAKEAVVKLKEMSYTTNHLLMTVDSDSDCTADLSVRGSYIKQVERDYHTDGENEIACKSCFVQSKEVATPLRTLLEKRLACKDSILVVNTRCNPCVLLGQQLHVQSNHFSTDFTGIVIGQSITYKGSLKAQYILLNKEIMEG